MSKALNVLIVQDSPDDAELLTLELSRGGFNPRSTRVEDAAAMREALAGGGWDVVLSDHSIPGFGAVPALALLRQADPDVPFLVVSGTIGEETAASLMRQGASDLILKESLGRLVPAVERNLREAENRRARRRAEQDAFRLATIVRSSADAIIGKDLTGTITDWNPAAKRLFGWPAAEAVGRHIRLIVPPDRAEEVAAVMERVGRGEVVHSFETVRLHRDGTAIDVATTYAPILDAVGGVVGISKVSRDISGKKRAEEVLRESEEQYRTLIDAVPEIVWMSDSSGANMYTNARWLEYTGARPGEPLGEGWARMIHPDDLSLVRELWGVAVRSEEPYESETRMRSVDGDYRWQLARARPQRDLQGRLIRWVGTCTDIHQQRLAEQALRESEERYRTLVDATAAIVWTSPPSGEFDSVQPGWTAFTGQRVEQHRSYGWLAAVHPEDREASAGAWAAAVVGAACLRRRAPPPTGGR